MDFEAYEQFVVGLMSPESTKDFQSKLTTAGLGLCGEAGETADLCKKLAFHGLPFTEEANQKLIRELGDQLFYITFAAKMICGVGLQEVLDQNVEKLSDRYKGGKFSVEEFMKKENDRSADH